MTIITIITTIIHGLTSQLLSILVVILWTTMCSHCNRFMLSGNTELTDIPAVFPNPKAITIAIITRNGITQIPANAFITLVNLKNLNLRENNISVINYKALAGLTNLRRLDLSWNSLISMPNLDVVKPTLSRLFISHNNIVEIDSLTFQGFQQLGKIHMQYNTIQHFPDLSYLNSTLTSLLLSGNRITRIVETDLASLRGLMVLKIGQTSLVNLSLPLLTKLITLDLRNSQSQHIYQHYFFTAVPKLQHLFLKNIKAKKIPNLNPLNKTLKYLHLEDNSIANIPLHHFPEFAELHAVNMSNNRLSSIHNISLRAKQLKVLHVTHNLIMDISQDHFSGLNMLKTVNLGNNLLIYFPDFTLAKNLRVIYLNDNNIIEYVKSHIIGLTKLTLLNMNSNSLTVFPDVSGFVHLKELYVDSNNITHVPGHYLEHTKALTDLSVKNNRLVDFPDIRNVLSTLEMLDVSYNDISTFNISHILANDTNFNTTQSTLECLNLTHNQLDTFQYDILFVLNNLKYLSLDHNSLKTILQSSASFLVNHSTVISQEYITPQIKQLSFAHNSLSKFPFDILQNLNLMTVLDLTGNKLTTIPDLRILASEMVDLLSILVRGNPLVCDCHLQWIKQSMPISIELSLSEYPCTHPSSGNAGIKWTNLQAKDLICKYILIAWLDGDQFKLILPLYFLSGVHICLNIEIHYM